MKPRAPAAGARRKKARAARPPRVPWTRLAESATLARPVGDLDAARAAFRELPRAEQMSLTRELVNTRRGEITRAYADVVSVEAGHRLRGNVVEPDVCVVLIVKRKWAPGSTVREDRRVPDHFFAYWGVRGERTLCAVPTDVEDGAQLARVHPQGQIDARVPNRPEIKPNPGAIACAVTRVDEDGNAIDGVYAISCRHVFGMALVLDPFTHHDAEIHLVGDGLLGRATDIAGPLVNGPAISFDSHLARVTDLGLLRRALETLELAGFVRSWDDLRPEDEYLILTPNGDIPVRYVRPSREPMWYSDVLSDVRHDELALFSYPDPDRVAQDGDSGSPVVTARTGGMLVGMHIAGNSKTMALAIPAWQLFHTRSYGQDGESWELWQG